MGEHETTRRSGDGLCVFQRVFNRLGGVRNALLDAPSVVVLAEYDDGPVVEIARVQSRANLVQRNPLPTELDVGGASLLGDAGNCDQFTAGSGERNGRFCGFLSGDDRTDRLDTRGREQDIPAWRRSDT